MEQGKAFNEITISVGNYLTMSGVEDIRGFDEGFVSLDTSSGRVSVEGENLRIESLTRDNGSICIRGNVTGVFCASVNKVKKGFFKRIFER